MKITVVYPTRYGDSFDPVYADLVLDQTRADGLRVNLDRRYPERTAKILDYLEGKTIAPILDLDDYDPNADGATLAAFAAEIAPQLHSAPFVEIGNEPWTMHRMPAAQYADLVNRIAPVLGGSGLRVALACDAMRPNGWADRAWVDWWREVVRRVTAPWDVAAIHPYRAGDSRQTWTHRPHWAHKWPRCGRWFYGSHPRSEEQAKWTQFSAGHEVAVTEVGWTPDKGAPEAIETWLFEELTLHEAAGVPVVSVYAHHGPFGVLAPDRTLSPQGQAIRRFQESNLSPLH